MAKFIVVNRDMHHLTPRRPTGRLYESRSAWSAEFEDAKIFQTKAAATNSARQAGADVFTVLEVRVFVVGVAA